MVGLILLSLPHFSPISSSSNSSVNKYWRIFSIQFFKKSCCPCIIRNCRYRIRETTNSTTLNCLYWQIFNCYHLLRCLPVLGDINLLFSNPQAIFPGCFLCQVNDKAEFQNADENGQVADCLPKIHCIEGSHFRPVCPSKNYKFSYFPDGILVRDTGCLILKSAKYLSSEG